MLQSPELQSAVIADPAQLELVKNVITTHCQDSEDASPEIMEGAVGVVSRLAVDPSSVAKLNESGVLRRVVRGVASHNDYVKNPDAMSKTLGLIEQCAKQDETVAKQLQDQGAQELIVAAMNANTTSQGVVDGGAHALQALGAGAEAGRIALEEVKALTLQIEQAEEVSEADVALLGDSVQKLSNFMLMEGVVEHSNVVDYLNSVGNAMSLMSESEVAQPELVPRPMLKVPSNWCWMF